MQIFIIDPISLTFHKIDNKILLRLNPFVVLQELNKSA